MSETASSAGSWRRAALARLDQLTKPQGSLGRLETLVAEICEIQETLQPELDTACLLLFALWAAKFSSDRNWRQYEVIFAEPVTGLTEGGSVQYNGIGVGTVDKLRGKPSHGEECQ